MAEGSVRSSGKVSAISAVPALPGAHASATTAGSRRSATHRACSRAPPPTTSTRSSMTLTVATPQALRFGRRGT